MQGDIYRKVDYGVDFQVDVGKILSGNRHIRRVQRYVTGSVYIVLGVTTAIAGPEKK